MAESLKILKKRLRSIRSTEHITHAMEMVAANKLRRTDTMLHHLYPYFHKIELLLEEMVQEKELTEHPLFSLSPKQKEAPDLYVILTSDRGLCGAFNTHILHLANSHLKTEKRPVSLYLVGKKAKVFPTHHKEYKVLHEKMELNGRCMPQDIDEMMENICKLYFSHQVRNVYVISYLYGGSSKGHTGVTPLFPILPFKKSEHGEKRTIPHGAYKLNFLFEPSRVKVAERVAFDYINSKLYLLMLEQFMCEHRFRMLSMNNATKSCKKLNEMLTLKANKARQASITKELLDIVGGAEAIS